MGVDAPPPRPNRLANLPLLIPVETMRTGNLWAGLLGVLGVGLWVGWNVGVDVGWNVGVQDVSLVWFLVGRVVG